MRSAPAQRAGWLGAAWRFCGLTFISIFPLILGLFAVVIYAILHKGPSGIESLGVLLPESTTQAVADWFQQLLVLADEPLRGVVRLVRFNADYKEQYYSALATLFAVIVGLALLKGIEGGDDTRQAYATEADMVRSMLGYLEYFESHEVSEKTRLAIGDLRAGLQAYAVSSAQDTPTCDAGAVTKELADCRRFILEVEPADEDDKIARSKVIELYEGLLMLRARRMSMDARSVPFYLRAALVLMAVALIAPFLAEPLCVDLSTAVKQYGLPVTTVSTASVAEQGYELKQCPAMENGQQLYLSPTRFSQYYMIFSLTAFFAFLLQLLQDVSTTHKGFWKVKPRAFQQLVSEMNEAPASPPR